MIYINLCVAKTSFNTQPPEGGCLLIHASHLIEPKFQHTAARRRLHLNEKIDFLLTIVSTHSRPKAAANIECKFELAIIEFQHTAARRRLPAFTIVTLCFLSVSTHSRPKAAASFYIWLESGRFCFNTQPPEGGCFLLLRLLIPG